MPSKFDITNPALFDPQAAKALTAEQWVQLHVPRFGEAAEAYCEYERFLKDALKEACRTRAPLAVVEARAKGIPSFAEKILRKRSHYLDTRDPLPPDPLVRLTDLCGGRIICQTASQVATMCRFIEEAFIIDWPNSEDVSKRLKTAEFGYRSVHYIIQVDRVKLADAEIKLAVPRVLVSGLAGKQFGDGVAGRRLKAEIQVRTLLEHASCDIGHDSIYKTELKVPERVKRQYAALAAVLESADREIDRVLSAVDDFKSNFGAWHEREEVEREIGYAQVLLSLDDEKLAIASKIPIAVRAAQLALAIGKHKVAQDVLKRFKDKPHAGVQRVLGQALTEHYWDQIGHKGFATGRAHLERAIDLAPQDGETIGLLAECAAHVDDDPMARKLFGKAMAAESNEPITLVHYLEFEIASAGADTPLRMAAPMLRAALSRARRQIEVRANLASAWSAVAMIELLLGDPFAAIHAIAQLIRLCVGPVDGTAESEPPASPCAAGRSLFRLRKTLGHLRSIREKLNGFDWIDRFILLALAARGRDDAAKDEVTKLASWNESAGHKSLKPHFDAGRRIIILAGGCEPDLDKFMQGFEPLLNSACEGIAFDLISGGTYSGISGVAGSIAANSAKQIRAFGYLPGHPPRGVKEDSEHFTQCFSSSGTDFTPMDPLQAWTDLIAFGTNPADIQLLCYAPGDIARAECAIALALGAQVGLVIDGALPKDRSFDAAAWESKSKLLLLPLDAMTLRAYLQITDQALTDAEKTRLEPAARLAHEDYVKSAAPLDASLQPWEKLGADLQLSNYCQVAYWEKSLHAYGLGIRRLTKKDKLREPLVMAKVLPKSASGDPVEKLAELEHGRWNVERLANGWRYAPEKDVAKKLSPWLIRWADVPKHIQKYDIDAINGLPKKLREAGLELYPL